MLMMQNPALQMMMTGNSFVPFVECAGSLADSTGLSAPNANNGFIENVTARWRPLKDGNKSRHVMQCTRALHAELKVTVHRPCWTAHGAWWLLCTCNPHVLTFSRFLRLQHYTQELWARTTGSIAFPRHRRLAKYYGRNCISEKSWSTQFNGAVLACICFLKWWLLQCTKLNHACILTALCTYLRILFLYTWRSTKKFSYHS